MIIVRNKTIKLIEDYESCSNLEKLDIMKLSQQTILHFVYPPNIQDNNDKKIYKSGFLNMFYSHINQGHSRIQIYETLLDKYDLRVSNRMFQKHIKQFKENYSYYVPNRI